MVAGDGTDSVVPVSTFEKRSSPALILKLEFFCEEISFFLLDMLTHMPKYYLVIMLYLSDVAQKVFLSSSYYSRCTLYVTDTCDNVKVCFICIQST